MSRPPGADFPIKQQADLAKLSKQELAEVWAPAEELLRACFARRPNYNDLVPALLDIGIDNELLLRCGLAMHIPMRPMLGGITRDLGEMLTKLQGRDFSCEFKYIGPNLVFPSRGYLYLVLDISMWNAAGQNRCTSIKEEPKIAKSIHLRSCKVKVIKKVSTRFRVTLQNNTSLPVSQDTG